MWAPVIEARRLTRAPAPARYWGLPIRVSRAADGRVQVAGDRHAGPCSGPATDGGPAARSCANPGIVYHAREAVGLIWVSIEDEPSCGFPLPELVASPPRVVVTGAFEVDGDLRVWMDHFLDTTHCIWTHAETAYGGTPDSPATLESSAIDIADGSTYPVRPAVRMTFDLGTQPGIARYSPALRAAAALSAARRRLRGGRRRATRKLDIQADLLTPLCQYTISRFRGGSREVCFEGVTAINPVAERRHKFFYAGFFREPGRSWLARLGQRLFLERFVPRHLGVEDATFLAETRFVPTEALLPTRADATVLAMRAMFGRHLAAKARLHPACSAIHRLAYA